MTVTTKGTWGGKREGAGRKPLQGKRHDSPHRMRAAHDPRHPVHVVLRVNSSIWSLRTLTMYNVMHRVLAHYVGREDFRIVHLSIQSNHLHLLIEAGDREALVRGMQSFVIRSARAINAAMGRTGKVFAFRYHATPIVTPRQARNALAYVLNNWRKHREDLASKRTRAAAVDPYASGVTFTGWSGRRFAIPTRYVPLPTSAPRSDLLARDWRRHGLIDPFEAPGPMDRKLLWR